MSATQGLLTALLRGPVAERKVETITGQTAAEAIDALRGAGEGAMVIMRTHVIRADEHGYRTRTVMYRLSDHSRLLAISRLAAQRPEVAP